MHAVPRFATDEFKGYLTCGRLEYGCVRVKCDVRRHEHLWPSRFLPSLWGVSMFGLRPLAADIWLDRRTAQVRPISKFLLQRTPMFQRSR
jgi:hypothetical protein